MKKILVGVLVGLALAAGAARAGMDIPYVTFVRLDKGLKSSPLQVNVPGSATLIYAGDPLRSDALCVNNTTGNLWVGGDNTLTPGNGIPVTSSGTFSSESYSGTVYGYCEGSNCDVRCWVGKVNR